MKRYQTEGIILRRVDFGEADRIITFLTPDYGKVGAMAKAVRKQKSKLAGGIELLSISELTLIKGKGKLDQIISSRLKQHFGNIVSDYERTQLAYQATAIIHKSTEDDVDEQYYDLLAHTYTMLDDAKQPLALVATWFYLQWARISGHLPNLSHDAEGRALQAEHNYIFDVDNGAFMRSENGEFNADTIKSWRIFSQATPAELRKVRGLAEQAVKSQPVLERFVENQL